MDNVKAIRIIYEIFFSLFPLFGNFLNTGTKRRINDLMTALKIEIEKGE